MEKDDRSYVEYLYNTSGTLSSIQVFCSHTTYHENVVTLQMENPNIYFCCCRDCYARIVGEFVLQLTTIKVCS